MPLQNEAGIMRMPSAARCSGFAAGLLAFEQAQRLQPRLSLVTDPG
jgi:hypothetical protein